MGEQNCGVFHLTKSYNVTDSSGVWLVNGNTRTLIQPTEAWLEERRRENEAISSPVPTQEDYMLDLEFRMTMLEMGM